MTLDDIKKIQKNQLTPAIVAKFLECDPHLIRVAAKDNPKLLGFPVSVLGSRVKIPKEGFIA